MPAAAKPARNSSARNPRRIDNRPSLTLTGLRKTQGKTALPLIFGRAVFPWVFRSPVSVSDGLLSIRRGFRAEELRAGFAAAGIERGTLRRRVPYRLVGGAERAGAG